MSDQDGSYRPRSPDFSGFASNYAPESYDQPQPPFPSPLAHRASYDASPYFNPQSQQPFPIPGHHFKSENSEIAGPLPQIKTESRDSISSCQLKPERTDSIVTRYPVKPQRAHILISPYSVKGERTQSNIPSNHINTTSSDIMSRKSRSREEDADKWTPDSATGTGTRSRKSRKTVSTDESGPPMGIEVKTKFPVARIKRIMQADEDVGKVAQVTPIAVSKALELFMITLVTKAATEARDRSSKRVTAAHLKQAIVKDEVLDFLADKVANVPDPTAKKQDEEIPDPVDGKKRKGGGRRRKTDTDDF